MNLIVECHSSEKRENNFLLCVKVYEIHKCPNSIFQQGQFLLTSVAVNIWHSPDTTQLRRSSCEKLLNPRKTARRPKRLLSTFNSAASLSCSSHRGRTVSALKREESSSPSLSPFSSHILSMLFFMEPQNKWLEVKDEEQKTLRQTLYIFLSRAVQSILYPPWRRS